MSENEAIQELKQNGFTVVKQHTKWENLKDNIEKEKQNAKVKSIRDIKRN